MTDKPKITEHYYLGCPLFKKGDSECQFAETITCDRCKLELVKTILDSIETSCDKE